MNRFSLSFQYIKAKPLSNALNILILALGTAVIVLLLLVGHQLEDKLTKNAKGIDLVVGAKGSPMQLILSSVFHIDYPTGNIKLHEAGTLARNRLVKSVIPLALGDSYNGFRIVGTNRRYPEHYGAELAQGNWWAHTLEATIGATVAQEAGLKIGAKFAGAHGMGQAVGDVHGDHLYTVVGVLKPTGTALDNLILANVESVWAVHEGHGDATDEQGNRLEPDSLAPAGQAHAHEAQADSLTGLPLGDTTKELTTMLVKFRSPMAAITLPRFVNSQTNMQAASPAFEVNRLFSILGVGLTMLEYFGYLVVLIATLSIFIALYNALKERRYDLAVMRALGSSPGGLLALVMAEGVVITLLGVGLGIGLGHLATELLGHLTEETDAAGLTGWLLLPQELYWLGASLVIGGLAALIPAINAYRTDISRVLARG
jgi:putative ABC transport system permease protein